MKRIAILALLVSAQASAHYQHIPESKRKIITDRPFASLPLTVTNPTEKEYSYTVAVNGKQIGTEFVLAGGQDRVIPLYLTMPEDGANKVTLKHVCSTQHAPEQETLSLEVCHKIQVYYAQ